MWSIPRPRLPLLALCCIVAPSSAESSLEALQATLSDVRAGMPLGVYSLVDMYGIEGERVPLVPTCWLRTNEQVLFSPELAKDNATKRVALHHIGGLQKGRHLPLGHASQQDMDLFPNTPGVEPTWLWVRVHRASERTGTTCHEVVSTDPERVLAFTTDGVCYAMAGLHQWLVVSEGTIRPAIAFHSSAPVRLPGQPPSRRGPSGRPSRSIPRRWCVSPGSHRLALEVALTKSSCALC
jgi:hypothetical protein